MQMSFQKKKFSLEQYGESAVKTKLQHPFELALAEDNPKFIETLLKEGLDLKSFLTYKRLFYLYNLYKV
jgi:hypothetical protein